jgi:hypothetical protein
MTVGDNVVSVAQFFFDFAKLSDGDIELVTVITNAACVRYQLLGAQPLCFPFVACSQAFSFMCNLCTG